MQKKRTLGAEELSRDVEGLAADDDNLLAVQELLGDSAGQTTEQMSLAVNDDLYCPRCQPFALDCHLSFLPLVRVLLLSLVHFFIAPREGRVSTYDWLKFRHRAGHWAYDVGSGCCRRCRSLLKERQPPNPKIQVT